MHLKLILISGLIALATPVAAQQQPAEYTIKLTPAELDLVGKALGSLSYNDVAQFVQKLRQQIAAQQQTEQPKKVEEPKK